MGQKASTASIDNIEFAVADIARSKAFYGTAFGWSLHRLRPAILRIQRRPADWRLDDRTGEAGRPLVILYADDLAATQARLEAAGARIVKDDFSFPGGRRFHFQDPDGYELAVWSDK